jgi:hypothetical protein
MGRVASSTAGTAEEKPAAFFSRRYEDSDEQLNLGVVHPIENDT